jgi:hypothetical protein
MGQRNSSTLGPSTPGAGGPMAAVLRRRAGRDETRRDQGPSISHSSPSRIIVKLRKQLGEAQRLAAAGVGPP